VTDPHPVDDVEPADEVRRTLLLWYRSWSDRTVVPPVADAFLFIGTDASEWFDLRADQIRAIGDRQREEAVNAPVLKPGDPQLWIEGGAAWAVDRPRLVFAERASIPLRLTAVAREIGGVWKLVHAHVSVGVPNEELIGRRLTTSIDELEAAVQANRPSVATSMSPHLAIMFSDIESSTDLLAQLGDDNWLDVLRWHNGVIREAVLRHDGIEVKSQGDGFMLAFPDPMAALRCATEIRAALRLPPRPIPAIRVRIGIHAGTVTKELSDYYGTTVHLAARIASAASGGEILVSDAVYDAITTAEGIRCGPGREVSLKGFEVPQVVYPVTSDDPT
jgi:adenylate cyclase